MLTRVGLKVGRALLVLILVTMGVVALLGLAPGSLAQIILGESATPEAVAQLNSELGLSDPLWSRYWDWIGGAVRGDLGVSPLTAQPIMNTIVERLPVTVELAVFSLVIALLVSIPAAIVSAMRAGSRLDRSINGFSSMLLSVPTFVAAPLLIYAFALKFPIFPVTGYVPFSENPAANLQSIFLPCVAIAATEIAAFHRILRTDLISTLNEDFVAAAHAKGLPRWWILLRHVLRPSSFSLLTLVGVNLGRLIGGTVVVEFLFALPGLGQLVTSSIAQRDIITVQGVVAFMAVTYVLINMLVDLSYTLLDPRVRGSHA